MTPLPPPSSGVPSSRTPTLGGRVQRDVRLQAALALVVGIAIVAVPLFLWGRGRKRGNDANANASTSASASDMAAQPVVIFGDAGASVAVDAGGRMVTFGEPKYLKCQDPGPTKTPADKCDHLGAIEELVTKTIADRVSSCLPPLTTTQTVNVIVDVSFKRKKMKVKEGKDGSTMPAAQRKKFIACVEKGLVAPNWDTVGHAHQRYLFQFLATFGASAPPTIPPAPTATATAPAPTGGPTVPP